MKRKIFDLFFGIVFFSASSVFAVQKNVISSKSSVDWTKNVFSSDVSLDTEKAGINMPSGKNSAINMIETELPDLIKDQLLSLNVNSNYQLGDLVLDESITLEKITQIIDEGRKSPGVFTNGTLTMQTNHQINILEISNQMIKHNIPYKNQKPIEQISSRIYTGIIIDARGTLPVHGEFIKDKTYPCFFPEIWDENMNLIYERNMGNPNNEKSNGVVHYDWSDDEKKYQDRVGVDPMHIKARKVYGQLRTDPVISRNDALKILTVPENQNLLRDGKVVILLDKENLVYNVSAPEKAEEYYAAFREVQTFFAAADDSPVIKDSYKGIQIMYDLKFVADSSELLSSELPKIQDLAMLLNRINENNAFTILVEGHTADVNKPEGQMNLSVARTQTIIKELVSNGLPRNIFSYKGYGGTQPIASNDTPEGRAQNRRVVITARPKATYIQRK